uniref:Uncharacterized protein n=1 Tax=Mus musculus TaxID=10090 RepID=Q8CF68_MOUSE|nr:unnamed protein product [Mus musculus]
MAAGARCVFSPLAC